MPILKSTKTSGQRSGDVLNLYEHTLSDSTSVNTLSGGSKWPPPTHIRYWPKKIAVTESDDDDGFNRKLESVSGNGVSQADTQDEIRSITGEEVTRIQWGSQIEFLLSCVGYSVGLGNFWRFPYLCMKHGGGAFIIPYVLFMFVCGMPLYFLEVIVGQSTGLSTVRAFSMIPFFQGLGWCMVAISALVTVYYNIIIAWILYYLGMSFNWELPWGHCNNTWNTPSCFTYLSTDSQSLTNQSLPPNITRTSAAEEFWMHNVLELSDHIENINGVSWKMLVAMISAWVLTFLCMCKGILSSGKIVYVTATLPYVFLTVILVRGVTLPGSWEGLKLYIVPDWQRLYHVSVWSEAATQVFYSLGPAWGGLITFSSFNRYNHKVMRDAIIVPIVCGLTSIYGGFAVFSVIGHLMSVSGTNSIDQLVSQGPGLAFVAYPQALTTLPGAAIWSVLFFLMLLTLGLDSQFSTVETVTTSLIDQFPKLLAKRRLLFTAGVCLIEFLMGFVLVTRAGLYYFHLFDDLATPFSVVLIGLFESIAFAYLYGPLRLSKDVEDMSGKIPKYLRYWWITAWFLLVPLFTLAVIVSTIVKFSQNSDVYLKRYPAWAFALGWLLGSLSFLELPIFAITAIIRHRSDWRKLFRFSDEWQYSIDERKKLFTKDMRQSTI